MNNNDAQENQAIIEANMPLVRAMARRFKNRGAEIDDLVQCGALALVKALARFDESMNTAFSSYAFKYVEGAMREFIRENRSITLPRNELVKSFELKRKYDEMLMERGSVTFTQAAELLGASQKQLYLAVSVCEPCARLNEMEHDAEIMKNAENESEKSIEKLAVFEAMNKLGSSEHAVIAQRYILDATQTQTAQNLGMSQSLVSKIEKRALTKLRGFLKEKQE